MENNEQNNETSQLPEAVKMAQDLVNDQVGRKAAVMATAALPVMGICAVGRAVKEWTAWNIFGKRN